MPCIHLSLFTADAGLPVCPTQQCDSITFVQRIGTQQHTAQSGITIVLLLQVLYEETKGDAIITTGVGQHQMWAAQWYKYTEPRRWASSGGLGSMGFGLPSAIGAAVAWDGTDKGRPKKVILAVIALLGSYSARAWVI